MLPPLNYRRGFQRGYFVLSLVWVTVIFFLIFSDNFKPWAEIKLSDWQVVSSK
jgi:hypothetical protein